MIVVMKSGPAYRQHSDDVGAAVMLVEVVSHPSHSVIDILCCPQHLFGNTLILYEVAINMIIECVYIILSS